MTNEGFRLSPQQRRLWRWSPKAQARAVIRIDGPLDRERLMAALAELRQRYEILRSAFRVLPGTHLPLQFMVAAPDIAQEAPFDFEKGDLLNATLSESEHGFQLELVLSALCADVVTLRELTHEIAEAYHRREPELEPVQYADVAEILNDLMEGEETLSGREYWTQTGGDPSFKLPFDYGSDAASGDFACKSVALDSATFDQLQTPQASLAACWSALLGRLGERGVIGFGFHGRSYEELADASGLFSRYIPLNLNPDLSESFEQWRHHFEKEIESISEYGDFFGGADEENPEWFPVAFEYHDLRHPQSSDQTRFELTQAHAHFDRFELKLAVCITHKGPNLELHYDTGRFQSEAITVLGRQLAALIAHAAQTPQTSVNALSLIDQNTQVSLADFNRTQRQMSQETAIQWFAQSARNYAAQTALNGPQGLMTYGELAARVNQFAHLLQSKGVGRDELVGVCLPRSNDTVVAILAVLAAGGAFVPMDPAYPVERLRFMMEDSNASLLITSDEMDIPFEGPCLRMEQLDLSSCSDQPCANTVQPQNLAYIIYTSGSTGRPKGVMISHAGLTHYLGWARDFYLEGKPASASLHSPIGFDLTVTSLFLPLISGGCLHILPEASGVAILEKLASYMNEGALDLIKMTPAHLDALARMVPPERMANAAGVMILGGEALHWESLRLWREQAPTMRLINEYGPTETVVGCAVHDAASPESGPVPIGRPVSNMRLYLFDKQMQPTPLGVAGELYIAGAGVARGYLNRPGLTASRFVPEPIAPELGLTEPGARMYRTGDAARFRLDGQLEFIGRLDHQVKLLGNRIELGEISAVLTEHSQIEEAIVLLRHTEGGEPILVAYHTGDPGEQALRSFVSDRLPEKMVPTLYQSLETMPLTANGKIDRDALASRPLERSGQETVLPSSNLEEALLLLCRDVLGLKEHEIGATTPFFDVGGHSLLLIKLHIRIQDIFRIEIGVNRLFESPTVRGFASLVEEVETEAGLSQRIAATLLELSQMSEAQRRAACEEAGLAGDDAANPLGEATLALLVRQTAAGEGPSSRAAIQRRPNPDEWPLSFAQSRLWFFDQLDKGNPIFNAPWAFELRGPLNVEALARSFSEIERRHETLRTVFVMRNNQPTQLTQPHQHRDLAIEDLTDMSPQDRDNHIKRSIHDEAHTGFDLEHGPVWRSRLLATGQDQWILLVTLHHICTDGRSIEIILREIALLYPHFAEGASNPLSELPIQYVDYAWFEQNRFRGSHMEQQLDFWRTYLSGIDLNQSLPTDHPRGASQTFRGASLPLDFDATLSESLHALCKQEQVTLYMTLFAAYAVTLSLHSGRDQLMIGADAANREYREVEGLVGFFVNQLVLRANLDGDPSLRDLIHRIRTSALSAYQHQETPFDQIVKAFQLDRKAAHPPLFGAKFFLEHGPVDKGESSFSGIEVRSLESNLEAARIDLTMGLWDTDTGIRGWLNYNAGLFEEKTITGLAERLHKTLQAMAASPDMKLETLKGDIMEQEREQAEKAKGERRKSNIKKFKKGKRKVMKVTDEEIVTIQPMSPDRVLPVVVRPKQNGVNLAEWIEGNRDTFTKALHKAGTVLFRGFGVDNIPDFDRFGKTVLSEIFKDNGEHQPVSEDGAVQVPVDYSADQFLLWHNENSFNMSWPTRIIFACAIPAQSGGETPLVDSREMFRMMRPELRDRFVQKGVMYVRNYSDQLGLSWRKVFGTDDRAEVEQRCREDGFNFEWLADDQLRTTCVRPAVVKHPATGETCWFNQAQHWHFSCLDEKTRQSFAALYGEEDYPRNCYFGDGSRIADEEMAEILELYRTLEIAYPWEKGDVAVVDNLLAAHARKPYTPPRKILVTMGDMMRYDQLPSNPVHE